MSLLIFLMCSGKHLNVNVNRMLHTPDLNNLLENIKGREAEVYSLVRVQTPVCDCS